MARAVGVVIVNAVGVVSFRQLMLFLAGVGVQRCGWSRQACSFYCLRGVVVVIKPRDLSLSRAVWLSWFTLPVQPDVVQISQYMQQIILILLGLVESGICACVTVI